MLEEQQPTLYPEDSQLLESLGSKFMILVVQSHWQARYNVSLHFFRDTVNHIKQLGTQFLEGAGGRQWATKTEIAILICSLLLPSQSQGTEADLE